jgi:hypothetical protein
MTTHYAPTDQGGMKFISERRPGEVRIPNYVYDIWMPLLGIDAIGVYAVYCRLEREGTVKAMSQRRIAQQMRIGRGKLGKINSLLQDAGFIKMRLPSGHEKLMHWTAEITVRDPPQEVPQEMIDKLKHPQGYETLCPWLTESPKAPNGAADDTKQSFDKAPNGAANVAPSCVAPLDVEKDPPAADSPPAEEPFYLEGETPTRASEPRTAEQHQAGARLALEAFVQNGGRPGVADPTQGDPWADKPLKAFCVLVGQDVDYLKPSKRKDWPRSLKEWGNSFSSEKATSAVSPVRKPLLQRRTKPSNASRASPSQNTPGKRSRHHVKRPFRN